MQTKKPNLRDKIKHFIEEYYGQYGTSPTIRCIADNVGCSKSNVPIYIEDLKEQGLLEFTENGYQTDVTRATETSVVAVPKLATIYDDDNYYLICYYGRFEGVVHYRIDRMDRVEMVVNQPIDVYKGEPIDLKRHKKTLFGMFQGEEQLVEFQADASILDPIFDIFGDKVEITPDENGKLRFKAAVQLSPTFFGWCLSFGDKLQVVGPNEVVEKIVEYIHLFMQGYKRNQ